MFDRELSQVNAPVVHGHGSTRTDTESLLVVIIPFRVFVAMPSIIVSKERLDA
jgi:hypothetical protein